MRGATISPAPFLLSQSQNEVSVVAHIQYGGEAKVQITLQQAPALVQIHLIPLRGWSGRSIHPTTHQMQVQIHHARDEILSAGVDSPGVGRHLDRTVRADCDDPFTGGHHGHRRL